MFIMTNKKGGIFPYIFWIFVGLAVGLWMGITFIC